MREPSIVSFSYYSHMNRNNPEEDIRCGGSSQHLQERIQMFCPVIVLRGMAVHVLQPSRLLTLAFGLHSEHIDCCPVGEDLDDERDGAVPEDDVQVLRLDPVTPVNMSVT
jgi:hypothetical protein